MPLQPPHPQNSRSTRWLLSLYVRGSSGKTAEAFRNLKNFCEERIPGQYEIEVIDIEEEVERAAKDGILAVPMLVRVEPLPVRRIIGNLSDFSRLAFALNIQPDDPD